uniref:RING-type E3 ubiquitin transferase BRCA1 n=1 Tax=Cynoglossus semilaevis TaxID=244447 RepID=A0A3P8VB17_CYNSE
MKGPKAADVKKGIAALWETMQCPICLDLFTEPVSTKCDHQFCKFCIIKLLDNSKENKSNCPVCKNKITKRSLRESSGFQQLVAGLQDMIQGYEHDTGTNYFTGTYMPKKQSSLQLFLLSHFLSNISAQNGFARLMDFEDSSPLTAGNEGLDSGLGEAPPTFEKKLHSSPDNLEQMDPDMIDAMEESSRKKRKKDLGSDMVNQEKRKKSLQKVAEWLLKVPPEGSSVSEEDNKKDDSDSSSSTSTIDVHLQISDVKREDRSKALEERVFGAVYKRRKERRRLVCPLPPAGDEALTSVEQKTGSEDEDQGDSDAMQSVTEGRNDSSSDIFEEAEQMEEVEENDINLCGEKLQDLAEIDENKSIDEDIVAVSGFKQQQAKQVPKVNMNNTLQHVDSDLQEQAETELETSELKKTDRKKGKNTQSKVSNPLVLVGVPNAESNSKLSLRSEQVQVQIENYPSSDDQETLIRSTRRSRRLQLFATEVSKVQRKAKLKINSAEKHHSVENPPEEGKGKTTNKLDSPDKMNIKNMSKRNGCVYDQDLGGIELMDANQLSSHPEQEPVAEVPVNTEAPLETRAARDVAVIESGKLVCETECALTENGEKNDSEVDTEQLLQSFKATKRKSFHLGCPDIKRNRPSDQLIVQDSTSAEEKEEEPSNKHISKTCEIPNKDTLQDDENSLSDDVIPPSNSSILGRKTTEMPVQGVAEAVISIPSSALTPNKVSKLHKESPHLSVLPQIVDSRLCYVDVNQTEPHEVLESSHIPNIRCDSPLRDTGKSEESHDSASGEKDQGNTTEHISAADSLTPDGLVATETKPSNCDEELQSSSSSINSNPRRKTKKRRIQLLESSSESDCATSEYVCVTPEAAEELRPPPSCPSPDYVDDSQASVDLFGTPEQCDTTLGFTFTSLSLKQKIQMQNELVRLEKLMALVSEVLQEKESSPAKETNQSYPATGTVDVSDADPLASPKDSDDRDVHQPSGSNTSTTDPSKAKTFVSSTTKTPKSCAPPSDAREDKENDTPPKDRTKPKLVLVLSGLGPIEQITVKKFAKSVGGRVVPQVTPEVTHVIMHTDEHLVCQRTLKYFLGIAGRKWVLSFNCKSWFTSLRGHRLFEVKGDMVNGPNHQGPTRARTTEDSNVSRVTPTRDSCLSRRATVVTRGWLLDTVSTYTLQNYQDYLL